MNEPVVNIELRFLLAFLVLASITGLMAGAALIMRPSWLAQRGRHVNRWISTHKLEEALNRMIDLDRWFYQHHRASGLLLLAGACWIIVFLVSSFDKLGILDLVPKMKYIPYPLVAGMLDGCVLLGLAGAVFAALVSLFLLLRPSLLREFERGVNQWVATCSRLQSLDIPYDEADRYVLRHSRLFGLLLLSGSLFMLGMLAFWFG